MTTSAINITTVGNTIVVPAQPGLLIQLQGLYLRASVLTTFSIKSGSHVYTGPMTFPVGGDMFLMKVPPDQAYFQTDYGDELTFTTTGLVAGVAGFIIYNISG